jgi:hypothetical protein
MNMSFAVTAVSKALSAAGINHLITEGGKIVVESYDPKAMQRKPIKAVKTKTGWTITRSSKMIPSRDAYALLMRLKRAAGYGTKEKKMREILGDRAGHVKPKQGKAMKKAWLTTPKLKAKHKAAMDAKKGSGKKKVAKPAAKVAKKVVKPAKKVAKVVKKVRRV